MKLLLCGKCNDVFSLRKEEKSCTCGSTKGRYIDSLNVEWSGIGFVVGFHNGSLISAIRDQQILGDRKDGMGRDFTAFIIPSSAPSVKTKG